MEWLKMRKRTKSQLFSLSVFWQKTMWAMALCFHPDEEVFDLWAETNSSFFISSHWVFCHCIKKSAAAFSKYLINFWGLLLYISKKKVFWRKSVEEHLKVYKGPYIMNVESLNHCYCPCWQIVKFTTYCHFLCYCSFVCQSKKKKSI